MNLYGNYYQLAFLSNSPEETARCLDGGPVQADR